MKVKELISLLQKFPQDIEVLYDARNQLRNENACVVYGQPSEGIDDFDGFIEDFYIDRSADGEDLLCLIAKPKED